MSRIGASPRWHGGIMTGQGCVLASVCLWTAEKCWAKSSKVLLKRPAWEIGSSRKHTLSARFSQRCCSWTTRVDIAWPMAYSVTGGWSWLSCAVPASSPSSKLPSCSSFNALAWCTCKMAITCRVEAVCPELPSAHRPWMGSVDDSSSWRHFAGITTLWSPPALPERKASGWDGVAGNCFPHLGLPSSSSKHSFLSFHCWLYSLCIVVYVTNKTWNLKLETWRPGKIWVSFPSLTPTQQGVGDTLVHPQCCDQHPILLGSLWDGHL